MKYMNTKKISILVEIREYQLRKLVKDDVYPLINCKNTCGFWFACANEVIEVCCKN